MKYCNNCGKEIEEQNIEICPYCNGPVEKPEISDFELVKDSGSIGYTILGFILPLIGIILYFVWKKEKPRSAKRSFNGALLGFLVTLIIAGLYFTLSWVISLG